MCGIGGILRVTPPQGAAGALARPMREAIPEGWLDLLDESIKHRGPDGQGRFRDRAVRADGTVVDVALVHRRLSIIDHAGGGQPMVSVRKRGEGAPSASAGGSGVAPSAATPLVFHGRPNDPVCYRPVPGAGEPGLALGAPAASADLVAVVFNGCIYNHRELRKELQAAGHEFVTDHSDTEVLVHGWREWGQGLFGRLDGMFAAAIWDRGAASLVLVRDACGEKPLYHTDEIGTAFGTAFASTAAALIRMVPAMRGASIELDRGLLASWIQMGFGNGTPSWDVQEIAPGEARTVSPGGTFGSAADQVRWYESDNPRSPWEAPVLVSAGSVEDMLRRAVESRLEADVPLGCFLSAGLDSSLIAALAQRSMNRAGRRLRTFTVRMPDTPLDESSAAAWVAAHLGTDHTTVEARIAPVDDLSLVVLQMGVPLGDSSLLPTRWVSEATRQHATVALSGDGGDELFCGYQRHRADQWLRERGKLLRRIPSDPLPGRSPRSASVKARRLIAAAKSGGYPQLVALFQHDDLQQLVPGIQPAAGSHQPRPEGRWFDYSIYLPEDLLRKVDSASMSVGLEVRAPMLRRELVAACMSAKEDVLMPNGQRKGLLRQVARKYLPAEIVDRPKQGFAIPIGEWFRSDYGGLRMLLHDRLGSREPFGPDRLGINAMINMEFVRRMLREHDDAGARSLWPWKGRDHSQRLYMLLVLSIWGEWLGRL